MIRDDTLRKEIADLGPEPGRRAVRVQDQAWTVTLTVERHDEFSCLLWAVGVSRQDPLPGDQAAWAGRLADRVTGLLERLKVYEIDPARRVGLLRSENPTVRDQAVQYFEVELRGMTEAQVRRFHGYRLPGHPREQVAFPMTYETLARLASDLTAEK